MITKSHGTKVWIGLVGFRDSKANPQLEGCPGAYSNLLTLAVDKSMFHEAADMETKKLELTLVEVVWAEPLEDRMKLYDIDAYLLDLAKEVERSKGAVWGKFHTWEKD